jgi:hypothetical protein
MKRFVFFAAMICLMATSCSDLFGSKYSVEGKWGMVSGGIKKNGSFNSIEEKSEFYKTIEFMSDGTFVETCGTQSAEGTYSVTGQSITYSYTDYPDGGPEYFAIRKSGKWTFHFWDSDSFTLYDFASPSYEVSMTFEKI